MIGFLRFVGILNAAVWLGAAVFLCLGAEPAIFSQDSEGLLQKSFTYLSTLLAQDIRLRFFYLTFVCGAVATLHLMGEWLYLGRPVPRASLWLLTGLVILALLSGGILQPRLKALHSTRLLGATVAERQTAQRSFGTFHAVSNFIDLLLIGGLAAYLWRMANPPDSLRFLSATKFHS